MAQQLVDQWGRPVETSKLMDEQSGPTLTGVRHIWSAHPSRGLTPSKLASILLEAELGDPIRYFELAEDMEEKDLHYLGIIGTRKRKVAQLEITVDAASESADDVRMADEVRELLRRDTLQDELFDMLDAIGKGVSCSEIIWEMSAQQWNPCRIKWREPKWFGFDPRDGETLMLRDFSTSGDNPPGLVPLTPYKYVTHIVKAKSGVPIRGGLARCISWIWLFKNFSVKDWVTFSEAFGQPYRLGKYDPSATPDDKDALLRAVASLGADAAAIIPKSMMIELLGDSNKSGSIDVYDRLTRFLDEQESKAVLGQTLTTEVTAHGGNKALGSVHADVAEDIRDADAQQLQATLNRDYVRPYIDLNHGPQKKYPRLVIGRPDELTLTQRLDYTAVFAALGMEVERSQVRDRLGWEEPKPGAEILRAQVAPAAAATAADRLKLVSASLRTPSLGALKALSAALDAGADGTTRPDVVDQLTKDALADDAWQPVMTAVVDPIREFLDSAQSLEDARARLAELVGKMDTTKLAALLGNAEFAAHIAGAVGVEPGATL